MPAWKHNPKNRNLGIPSLKYRDANPLKPTIHSSLVACGTHPSFSHPNSRHKESDPLTLIPNPYGLAESHCRGKKPAAYRTSFNSRNKAVPRLFPNRTKIGAGGLTPCPEFPSLVEPRRNPKLQGLPGLRQHSPKSSETASPHNASMLVPVKLRLKNEFQYRADHNTKRRRASKKPVR